MEFIKSHLGLISNLGLTILAFYPIHPKDDAARTAGKKVTLPRIIHFFVIILFCIMAFFAENSQQKEMAALSTKNDIENTLKIITGGKSSPWIEPKIVKDDLSFRIMNDGDFGLFDLTVQVTDEEAKAKRKAEFEAAGREYSEEDFFFGPIQMMGPYNIPAKQERLIYNYKKISASTKEMNFIFGFVARNGSTSGRLNISRQDDRWAITYVGNGLVGEIEKRFIFLAN